MIMVSVCRFLLIFILHSLFKKVMPQGSIDNVEESKELTVDKSTQKIKANRASNVATVNSRLRRLEQLVEQRQDLVEEYQTQVLGDRTIFHLIGKHVIKAIQFRHIFPVSDRACYWNYWRERCEPVCLCSWKHKFGDLLPGRSCRLKRNDTSVSSTSTSISPISHNLETLSPISHNLETLMLQNESSTEILKSSVHQNENDCDTTLHTGPIRGFLTKGIRRIKGIFKKKDKNYQKAIEY